MNKLSGFKQNITKFSVDLLIFIGFLLALDHRTTGATIHEWLGIAGAAAIIIHLLLSWNWIVEITRRFFRKAAWRARIHYILNWLLFINGVLIILSGIMISEVVLPTFSLQLGRNPSWSRIHSLTTDISIFILGLHVALHWDWIMNMVKRYLGQPFFRTRVSKQAKPEDQVQS